MTIRKTDLHSDGSIFALAGVIEPRLGILVQLNVRRENAIKIGKHLRYDVLRSGNLMSISQIMTLRGPHIRLRWNRSGSSLVMERKERIIL